MTTRVKAAGRQVRQPSDSDGPTKAELVQQLGQAVNNLELAQESIAELELSMEDIGWQRMIAIGEREFTRDGLRAISAACQLYALKNPLIRRGLILRQAYVWGQGVEITARANGKRGDGEQDVNAVVQAFLDDAGNRRALFGAEAHQRIERALGTDGNLFVSLWTRPATGKVQARLLPWEEITDVISNPEDASEPWFYRRTWNKQDVDPATGVTTSTPQVTLYPAISYRPKDRPSKVRNVEVRWDAPVRHIKVNDLQGWRFGVPDAYAAMDWARAYKEFLEDWARLVKSLSRYAWRTTAKGAAQAAAIRARTAAAPPRNPATGEPLAAGATVVTAPDTTLEAIPKTGATIDSESGKPIAAMVAAALGIPVTMLLADPGQTGARATAETLDQPTQLEMGGRRGLWTDVLRDLCEYVIRESVRASKGALKGKIVVVDDVEVVTLDGDTETTIDIDWPGFDNVDMAGVITAVAQAQSTGTVRPEIVLRLLLTALGVKHVDEIVDEMTDEEGNFLWPEAPPLSAGSGGGATDPGSMTPDDTPDDTPPPDEPPPDGTPDDGTGDAGQS